MKRWVVVGLVATAIAAAAFVAVRRDGEEPAPPTRAALTEVVFAADRPPATLDPTKIVDVNSLTAALACHASLAVVAHGGEVRPVLASQIDMADDALSCEIELRDGCQFWDRSALTAEDVVASVKRLRRSAHPHAWILDLIDGIAALDDKSSDEISGIEAAEPRMVRIRFSSPDPDFPKFIASSALMITKAGSENSESRPFDSHVIGAGPFAPVDIDPGTRIQFRRNPGFPVPSTIEVLEMRFVESPQAQLSAIQSGEAHLVRLRGPMLGEALRKDPAGRLQPAERFTNARLVSSPANELTFMALNFKKDPMSAIPEDDRRAWQRKLSAALDPAHQLVDSTYIGAAAAATSSVPPTVLSVAGAAREPGRVDPVTVELLCANDPDSRRLGQYAQSRARTIGITFEIVYLDLAQLASRLIGGEHQAALLWIEQQVPAAVAPWVNFFDQSNPMVALAQPVEGVGEMQRAARSVLDPAERADAYRKLVQHIDAQQTVWVPIVSRDTVYLADERLDGVFLDANGLLWFCFLTSKP